MKRYDIEVWHEGGTMAVEDPEGEWVRWEDAARYKGTEQMMLITILAFGLMHVCCILIF